MSPAWDDAEMPLGAGVGDIDSPPPTEVANASREGMYPVLSARELLLAREVARLVVGGAVASFALVGGGCPVTACCTWWAVLPWWSS